MQKYNIGDWICWNWEAKEGENKVGHEFYKDLQRRV